MLYICILSLIYNYAEQLLNNPPLQNADVVLILGNRAYLNGKPNPCLTGRVDKGLTLANEGLTSILVMSGGLDHEDKKIEALTMEAYARNQGFKGTILLESQSNSTLENLTFSRIILKKNGIKSVIITSEPFHMWRIRKLVEAGSLGNEFNVSFAAATTQCRLNCGILFKGSLREPLAIIFNYAKGYF